MKKNLKKLFFQSPYLSTKFSSYFDTYDKIFSRYINKKITFVEVGILNGGSLFMWRKYFGKKARIIGIDNNPSAKFLEKYGFEIFIGDQSNINFWNKFKKKVGPVDILLDDGGHKNYQQATTLFCFINNIKDKGLLVIEDTHASYLESFGNPSKLSFINLTYHLVNLLNFRSGVLKEKNNYGLKLPISEIRYFESMVAFEVNRRLTNTSYKLNNNGINLGMKDFRSKKSYKEKIDNIYKKYYFFSKIFILGDIINILMGIISKNILYKLDYYKEKNKMKNFFKLQ